MKWLVSAFLSNSTYMYIAASAGSGIRTSNLWIASPPQCAEAAPHIVSQWNYFRIRCFIHKADTSKLRHYHKKVSV